MERIDRIEDRARDVARAAEDRAPPAVPKFWVEDHLNRIGIVDATTLYIGERPVVMYSVHDGLPLVRAAVKQHEDTARVLGAKFERRQVR